MKATIECSNVRQSLVPSTGITVILLLLLSVLPAVAIDKVELIGEMGGKEADQVLKEYLRGEVNDLAIEYQASSYEHLIDRLVTPGENPYLVRTTPYVFVVAEILGAKMEMLGVYKSKTTGTTTYNTYFVVNRKDFRDLNDSPTLSDLTVFLKRMGEEGNPAKFIAHSKFSTSSYFLPSLFFKNEGIYSMKPSGESVLIPIVSSLLTKETLNKNDPPPSSTDLVTKVGDNEGVFAAVWDGTKAKFEQGGQYYEKYGSNVYFIKLETPLPNDMLVSVGSLDDELKNRISTAITEMNHENLSNYGNLSNAEEEKDLGDVDFWIDTEAAGEQRSEARKSLRALTHLRHLARTRIRPAIIDIQSGKNTGVSEDHLEAAKHAVRLSGTELILKEESQHEKTDINWTLKAIHDEAIVLTSVIERHEEAKQTFRISYKKGDLKDLTKRFGDIIQSRMHRIRYLWPYPDLPTVIRDISFPIDPKVSVEKLIWVDPEKNEYELTSSPFTKEIESVDDLYKFQLANFDDRHGDFDDPISNISYRVVLKRPVEENKTLTVLTGAYVALMVFSATGAVYGCKRKTGTTAK